LNYLYSGCGKQYKEMTIEQAQLDTLKLDL
jgi:hypothetical protein